MTTILRMKRLLLGLAFVTFGTIGLAVGANSNGPNGNPAPNGPKGHPAPEINPGQALSALALLSGGVLIIRRKK
jgi:hypothetical protein